MNQVSWLIYLANVAGNMGGFLVFLGILALVAGVAYFVCAACFFDEVKSWDDTDTKTLALKTFQSQRTASFFGLFLAGFLWFCAALTPSGNTVLAIAASQFGEQLLHTKTASLAEQALNNWLQKQITDTTKAVETKTTQ